jgi:HEAT repeat protein
MSAEHEQVSNDSVVTERTLGTATTCTWVVEVAQKCEEIWNDSGRTAARRFAEENTALGDLRRSLTNGNSLERTKALYLMSLWEPSIVLEDFWTTLNTDSCPIVRHEAAYFLGTMRTQQAIDYLGQALLTDTDELVRHEAAEAIGEIGSELGLSWLQEAARDQSPLVVQTVNIAVNHITAKKTQI